MDLVADIVIKTVTYVLIYTIVKMVTSKVSMCGAVHKRDGEVLVIKKKGLSVLFLICAIIFTVIFSLVESVPTNVTGEKQTIIRVCCVCFCTFVYGLSVMYGLWEIVCEQEKIIFRNYFGRTKTFFYEEIISYQRISNGNLLFKTEKNKCFEVDALHATGILLWIVDRTKLSFKKEEKMEFIVRPAKYQRVLSVICLVASLGFILLGVVARHQLVTIVFMLFTIFAIYNFLDHYKRKYIVSKDNIECIKLVGKGMKLFFKDVSKVEMEYGDNIEYMVFYKKNVKKPVLKLNMYFENAGLLEDLAYKRKWM